MAVSFKPVNELLIYCRFCKKVLPAQLERGIANSGRTVDKNATFEYVCSKCHRSHCFRGSDIIERPAEQEATTDTETREYRPSGHYLVGEVITHPGFQGEGRIVNKEPGSLSRIVVSFEKAGVTKFVEDVA